MKCFLIAAVLLGAPAAKATQAPPLPGMNMPKTQATEHGKMSGMGDDAMSSMMKNTPTNPYAESEMAMHHSMMMAKGSDASETWTRKMIEHHRGAIAMSKIAVTNAKDAETRQMAEKVVAAQTQEVADLQGWLKRHGKTAQ